MLKRLSGIMRNTTAYRLWQAPFASVKLAPVLHNNDLKTIGRVLDVGCGPGTNCQYFKQCDYTGMDINPQYIEYARRKFGRPFVVQDVCTFEANANERFDFVLMNSLLHHLDDAQTNRILQQIAKLLTPHGCVNIIDLVLPETRGLPRWLALNDRGDYPRSLRAWQELFEANFQCQIFEQFPVGAAGVELWSLVYFKGILKT